MWLIAFSLMHTSLLHVTVYRGIFLLQLYQWNVVLTKKCMECVTGDRSTKASRSIYKDLGSTNKLAQW